MNPNETSDLHLLAFRYLHEELSASERQAFERQLADDQSAREALAEAVELSHACHAALATPVSTQRKRNWVSIAGWAVGGVAAVIAVVAVLQSAMLPANHVANKPTATIDSELISAWSEGVDWNEQNATAGEESAIPMPGELAEFEFVNDTPGWMLSAVQSAGENDMESDPSSDTQ